MAAAVLLAYFLARKYSWRYGIVNKDIDDYAFWVTLVGILGARAYYVIFSSEYYGAHLNEIPKIWMGGLSIYGALIAGLIFTFLYTRNKAYGFWHLTDLVALSLPLSQALGRMGNFINQEAYGTETNLPWKIYIPSEHSYHHPTFMYEAIGDVIVFLILLRMRGKTSGNLTLTYLLLYSIIRFLIESLRLDSQYLLNYRVDQITAIILIVISGTLLIRNNFAKVTKHV